MFYITSIMISGGRRFGKGWVSVFQRGRAQGCAALREQIGRAHALFGDGLAPLLEELNLALAG